MSQAGGLGKCKEGKWGGRKVWMLYVGADRFLSQLETLKNMIDPEDTPGDEQDNAGDNTCIA